MSEMDSCKQRNVAAKQYRAYYIVQRRMQGATLTEIAQELNVNPRTITRDINDEYYQLTWDELIQQQIQTIQQLIPKDAWKARQKLLELLQPTHHAKTTTANTIRSNINANNNHASLNINPDKESQLLPLQHQWQLNPDSKEFKNYYTTINSCINKQMQDQNSQAYKYCYNYIESRVDEGLKDPNSQIYKEYTNILQTRTNNMITITHGYDNNKVASGQTDSTKPPLPPDKDPSTKL
jgi:hypothetical protein